MTKEGLVTYTKSSGLHTCLTLIRIRKTFCQYEVECVLTKKQQVNQQQRDPQNPTEPTSIVARDLPKT